MGSCRLIDTFPAFRATWRRVRAQPLSAQIEAWAGEYMAAWPELLDKQLDDYGTQEIDWQSIACERIFPFLGDRLPAMEAAHRYLLRLCPALHSRAQRVLGLELEATFVIYVGIGCGAGWSTSLQGSPAVLLGLESIAECGWSQPQSMTGLVAHEIGHLAHDHWRAASDHPAGSGPWWQLYREGFAQWLEHTLLRRDSWHMMVDAIDASSGGGSWLQWCQAHRGWLAAEFLRFVDEGASTRQFFGSWFGLRGRSQCGYFLGHELVRELASDGMNLRDVALLEDAEQRVRDVVVTIAVHNMGWPPGEGHRA